MNRIRGGVAIALGVALLLAAGGTARAQEITGRLTGRVTDKDTNMPLGGVTVVLQGAQGEDATLTDDKGEYNFTSLPVGTYVIRFYVANAAAQVEQSGVVVAANTMRRVNVQIAGAAQAQAQEKYVITGKPPLVDIGSARVGATFDSDFTSNIPLNRTYGDVIERAPGAFVDPSGNVSIGGATGLENIYIVNGVNVTGIEYGNLEAGTPSISGGTNLPLEFLQQIDVSAGGYNATLGGGQGGVINSVLKTGTNEIHGSVFGYWSPYWFTREPTPITTVGGSLGYVRKPDYDTSVGVEVGGPILKDKLFFWLGFAPRLENGHVFRQTYLQLEDGMNPGHALLDANGHPIEVENTYWRARIPESRQTYFYAGTLDFIPRPEHHLTIAAFGSPSFNQQMRSFGGYEAISNPAWAQEKLTKSNADVSAHWTSKLYDHHWQIDVLAGLHTEYFYDRSPNDQLNNLNQLEYHGANLWDLEGAPGCEPTASGFQPCPVDGYRTGGFGAIQKKTGVRYMTDIKSTHLFEAGGHHEIAWGWHPELVTLDEDRWYSGPLGARGLVMLYPNDGYHNTYSFFTLQPGQNPSDIGLRFPASNLLYYPQYQDDLKASVKSIVNAFFLNENYNPQGLRNLTVNVGGRVELQKLYDFHGNAFMNATNLSPRVGAIYDPFNDGRSKLSVFFGRYYEAIPLNVAARYFGGEGIMNRNGVPFAACANQSPYTWTGAGEFQTCRPPFTPAGTPMSMWPADNAGGGSTQLNNGSNYPVQADLQGQYHNEIVATAEREVIEDLSVRLDYQHRWLGNIIEDGAADPSLTFVLANPGHVPQSALDEAQNYASQTQAALDAQRTMDPNSPAIPQLESNAAAANARLTALKGLAQAPKPARTYDAITASINKRFSKNWLARAAYTYSRLIGNYEGLYQAEQNYFAPNGNNAYDTPDLYANSNGPLPNDRPHLAHVDGFYTSPMGGGFITVGLSFAARSGMPRNYMSALIPSQQLVFLLPRGSGGRTPTTTELNGRIAYRRQLAPKVSLEAFIDLFNMLNEQAVLLTDDNYTYSWAGPIVNGTPSDLKYAKDVSGAPIVKNPNYGQPLLYQKPFNGRFGMRLTF
ncbi:MAG TPA: carboxypeptidase regulatory-like domain-containing protein [Polyangia bacterium]